MSGGPSSTHSTTVSSNCDTFSHSSRTRSDDNAACDSLTAGDFIKEGGKGLKFLFDYVRNKPGTRSRSKKSKRADGSKLTTEGADAEIEGDWTRSRGTASDNSVGLDFEQAFAVVQTGETSDDDVDEKRHRDYGHDDHTGNRQRLVGNEGEDEYSTEAERAETGTTSSPATDLARPNEGALSIAYNAPTPAHHDLFTTSANPPAAYRPLPYGNSPAPQSLHRHVQDNLSIATREDWRPYTPPNVNPYNR